MRHLLAASAIAAVTVTALTIVAPSLAAGGPAPLIERTKLFGSARTASGSPGWRRATGC